MKLTLLYIYISIEFLTQTQQKLRFSSQKKFKQEEEPQIIISHNALKLSINETHIKPMLGSLPIEPMLPMDERNDGKHSYEQLKKIFSNKKMTSAQQRNLISLIDIDNSGDITFREWSAFYNIFWVPFKECDIDENYILNNDEFFNCITNTTSSFVFTHFIETLPDSINKYLYLMDAPDGINFYNYIYLRKVNQAFDKCSNDEKIQTNKIYCSLQYTSPRIKRIYIPDEKELFLSAQILKDGYYEGQQSTLDLIQFIGISYVYNYFTDYQIPFNEGYIQKSDMIKAAEDQVLPQYLTPNILSIFFGPRKEITFFTYINLLFAYRQYISISYIENGQYLMNYTAFTKACLYSFPQRLSFVINQSVVPSQFELENSSKKIHNINDISEDDFLKNNNNLIFLQKSQKLTKVFKKMLKKQVTSMQPTFQTLETEISAGNQDLINASTTPEQYQKQQQTSIQQYQNFIHPQGAILIFQIFDTYNNGTISAENYLNFWIYSILYLSMDHEGLQRITVNDISQLKNKQIMQVLTPQEKQEFYQLQDFISYRPNQFMNYKQFMSWFMVKSSFQFIKISGTSYTSTLSRSLRGFQKLGLRLSDYCFQTCIKGYNSQFQESTFLFRQAFFIAVQEEMSTMRFRYSLEGRLNSGFVP